MNLSHKDKSLAIQRVNQDVIVKGQDDDFELLAEVEDVVFNLKVFLLERHDELVHDQAREQIFLHDTQSVLEVSQQKY